MPRSDDQPNELAQREVLDSATLRAAFDLAPIGVTITRDGVTEYCNPAYLAMFGFDGHEQEIYGKSLLSMVAPEGREDILERIARRRAGDLTDQSYDCVGLRRDGTRFPFHVSVRRVELGGAPASLAFFFDISERRRMEEDLRQTNEKLGALIQACPVPVMLLDPDGIVRLWNPAAEEAFGWTEAEAVGRLNPLIADATLEEFRQNMLAAMTTGMQAVEARRRRKDGRAVDLLLWAAPVRDATGQPIGTMALTMDVTDRRQTEEALRLSQEQLRHAQKMEAVGRLAGGVAHDFNNLLTVISGFTELLRVEVGQSPAAQANLSEIRNAVGRAATLTRQLLAFSRQQEFRVGVVDLNEVVSGMERMLSRLIGPETELCSELAPDLGHVRADTGQLEQVITNLAVNGNDAMPRGGRLRLGTRNVDLEQPLHDLRFSVPAGRYVTLEVTDTGTGMDEAVLSRLFEPFFTTKARGKGTGLGLSTVYGIVTQSGGHLHVETQPGAGSTFRVFLPRVEGAAAKLEPASAHSVAVGTGAIVVVEDDPTLLRLISGMLEHGGYEVFAADNAERALELLAEQAGRVRLLLTDVLMPGVSGPALAERAWAERPELPVLFMSGFAEPASFPARVSERAAGYLSKPFERESLLDKVEQVLRSAR